MSWVQVTTTDDPPVIGVWINLDACERVAPEPTGANIVFQNGAKLHVTSTPDSIMLQAATGNPIK